jgi:uncharacterized protein YjbI with pentapeptide repeats
MTSAYMSHDIHATNAGITNATITNATLPNATITNATLINATIANIQPMPCHLAGYVVGANGTGFRPILCTAATHQRII